MHLGLYGLVSLTPPVWYRLGISGGVPNAKPSRIRCLEVLQFLAVPNQTAGASKSGRSAAAEPHLLIRLHPLLSH